MLGPADDPAKDSDPLRFGLKGQDSHGREKSVLRSGGRQGAETFRGPSKGPREPQPFGDFKGRGYRRRKQTQQRAQLIQTVDTGRLIGDRTPLCNIVMSSLQSQQGLDWRRGEC